MRTREETVAFIEQTSEALKGPLSNVERALLVADRNNAQKHLKNLDAIALRANDQDDYAGISYSNEWHPTYNPNNDPTLEFVGYEDDQPVWRRKKPQRRVTVDGVDYVPVKG